MLLPADSVTRATFSPFQSASRSSAGGSMRSAILTLAKASCTSSVVRTHMPFTLQ